MPLQVGRKLRKEFEGYTKMEVTIDSGAAASVIPERLLPGHRVGPSEGSRAGVHYLAADGGRIPNLGELEVGFLTKEKHRCRMMFQVAHVKRPLLAVSTLTRSGNDVNFKAEGGTITNRKTGRVIAFAKKGGVYVLEVVVAPPSGQGKGSPPGGSDRWRRSGNPSGPPRHAVRGPPRVRPGNRTALVRPRVLRGRDRSLERTRKAVGIRQSHGNRARDDLSSQSPFFR